MRLKDRFRINELVKKGSKGIERDSSKGITGKRIDGKQVKKKNLSKEEPFGTKPIKGKQISPKLKSDLNEVEEKFVQEQTTFSGETSGYIEKPKYNEEEPKKFIDVKVDELIKKEKQKKELTYVKQELYDKLRENFDGRITDIEDLRQQLDGPFTNFRIRFRKFISTTTTRCFYNKIHVLKIKTL